MKDIYIKTKKITVALMGLLLFSTVTYSQQNYWSSPSSNKARKTTSTQKIDDQHSSVFELDIDNFKQHIASTQLRGTSKRQSDMIVSFPDAHGNFNEYRIQETPVLSEELSKKYPNIKTYLGFSTDNKGTRIRFSVTPLGLNAMISPIGSPSSFVSPLQRKANGNYIIYSKEAKLDDSESFDCLTEAKAVAKRSASSLLTSRAAKDQNLRTLRIAISTTGEYTQLWNDGDDSNGTAKDDALAQVVSTLNRVNEVYEVDMAIHFTLVTGTEIIYDNKSSDPYKQELNLELQETLTAIVGEENYDIGHLFDYGINNGNAFV